MDPDEEFVSSFHTSLNLDVPQDPQHFATIHDLPTELLVRIFCAATEFRYSRLTLKEATLMLLAICRVSHYWRAIAFSIPELWGRLINVVGSSDDQMADFLEWSKPKPIEVFIDGESESRPTSAQLRGMQNRFTRVLAELDRISYLVIRRFHLTEGHFKQLHQSAPALDLFAFEGNSMGPVRLPPQLFSNNAPQLRSLRLVSALVDFEQVSYPALAELTVEDIRDPFSPPSRTWLILLSRHPRLESLKLSYTISVRYTDAMEWSPTVRLYSLRQFTLIDDATACAHILSKVKLPNDCRISVRSGLDTHEGLELLQNAFSALMSTRLCDNLQISLTGAAIAFSNALNDERELPFAQQTAYFLFKFQWQSSFEYFGALNLPRSLFDFMPDIYLASVKTLRIILSPINGRYPFDDDALFSLLREWLQRLDSVEHLILEMSAIDAVLDLISDYGDNDEIEDEEGFRPQSIIFPSLEGIEVVETAGEELDWGAFISFAEWREDIHRKVRYIRVPRAEVDNLRWKDASLIADLDIDIILT